MNNKKCLALAIGFLSMSMILTGCFSGKNETAETNPTVAQVSSDVKPTQTENHFQSDDIWWKENDFHGMWKVKERVETSNVYALSEEEIKNLIGTELFISESYFDCSTLNGRIADPVYNEMIMNTADFIKGFKLNDADKKALSLDKNKIYVIDVNFPEGEENNFGSHLFLVDKDRLLILKDGVFFRAERSESGEEETEKQVEDFDESKAVG